MLFWCNKSKETIKLHQKPYNEVVTLTPKFWLCHILVGIFINGNDYFFFIETHLYAPSASKQTTIECTRDQSHSLYVIKSKMKHPNAIPNDIATRPNQIITRRSFWCIQFQYLVFFINHCTVDWFLGISITIEKIPASRIKHELVIIARRWRFN